MHGATASYGQLSEIKPKDAMGGGLALWRLLWQLFIRYEMTAEALDEDILLDWCNRVIAKPQTALPTPMVHRVQIGCRLSPDPMWTKPRRRFYISSRYRPHRRYKIL